MLVRYVALKTGVEDHRILGRERTSIPLHARYMAWHLMYTHTTISSPAIALRFGDLHHTTILSGLDRYYSGKSLEAAQKAQVVLDKKLARQRFLASRVVQKRVPKQFLWTPTQIARARNMLSQGMSQSEVGKVFGVSRSAVQAALTRARRRELVAQKMAA